MSRFRPLLLAAVTAALVPAAATQAATVQAPGAFIAFSAAAAETNTVTVDRVGAEFVFTDSTTPLVAVAPCVSDGPNAARCPAGPVTNVNVQLGDGNDTLATTAAVTLPMSVGAGPGNDTVTSGGGNDTLVADTGNDTLNGGGGEDVIFVGASGDGADTYLGGGGVDGILYINRQAPLALSNDGAANDGEPGEGDNIGADVERITGGAGGDTIVLNDQSTGAEGANGSDTITGGAGDEAIIGGDGADTLKGGGGDDSISGGLGADVVEGGDGNDLLEEFTQPLLITDQPDVYRGGAGNDRISYANAVGRVNVTLDDIANDGVAGEGDNVASDIEDILGSPFADTLTGSAAANEIDGGNGNDVIRSLGGSDTVVGGRGDDTLDPGAGIDDARGDGGRDTIRVRDTSADHVLCGSETDTVVADGADVLRSCESASRGVVILTTTARAIGNRVAVRLTCPAAEGRTCAGTLRLTAGSLLGTRSFSIGSGLTRNVTVTLGTTGRRIIARRPGTRVTATARFTDATGTPVTTTRAITVRR